MDNLDKFKDVKTTVHFYIGYLRGVLEILKKDFSNLPADICPASEKDFENSLVGTEKLLSAQMALNIRIVQASNEIVVELEKHSIELEKFYSVKDSMENNEYFNLLLDEAVEDANKNIQEAIKIREAYDKYSLGSIALSARLNLEQ